MKTSAFLTLTLLLVSTTAYAQQEPFSSEPFTDVKPSSSLFEAVEYLRENNIVKGYPDGSFRANRRISRGEFVKLIVNPLILDTERINDCLKAEIPETSDQVFFPDVHRNAWYATEVCFAKLKRIIDGYPDGKFRPGGYISFVEVAKILSNVFSFEIAVEDQGEHWYVPYARRLAELNAIPTTVRRFDQMMTRGDMAEILYRLKMNRTDRPAQAFGQLQ